MSGGYIDQSLPFSGSSPLSRHCSAEGARDAVGRAGSQARRYLRLLASEGAHGLTDYEAAFLMNIERTSINARRFPFTAGESPWVVASGMRRGPTGIRNTVWALTDAGRRAVEAMDREY